MGRKHSPIGASTAYRWFECPGSVALAEKAPPQEQNEYAARGTAAHWVLEECLTKKGKTPSDFIGIVAPKEVVKDFEIELTDDDCEAVQEALDFINEVRREGKFILEVEAKFNLDSIDKDLFGTSDVVLIESNFDRLKIIDYKHGSGVPVQVENNKQLKYYALGAIQYAAKKHKRDDPTLFGWASLFKEVEIIVAQPRCRHKDGAFRRWVVPSSEIEKFADELKQKANETRQKNAPLKSGDHCRWCPALAICPQFQNAVVDSAKADFRKVSDEKNLKLPDPSSLTLPEIAKIMRFSDMINEWLKAVQSHVHVMLEHGEEVPGFKLVKKRANRKWISEDTVLERCSLVVPEDELYTKKIKSPNQVEKVLGKKHKDLIKDLYETPDNGTTVAPDHDPRNEVKGSAVQDFAADPVDLLS
jgi:hypothetical protein